MGSPEGRISGGDHCALLFPASALAKPDNVAIITKNLGIVEECNEEVGHNKTSAPSKRFGHARQKFHESGGLKSTSFREIGTTKKTTFESSPP